MPFSMYSSKGSCKICGTPNVIYNSLNTLEMTCIPYIFIIFLLFYICVSKLREFQYENKHKTKTWPVTKTIVMLYKELFEK